MNIEISVDRLRSIDATRGTAMLFVFLSHFADAYMIKQERVQLVSALHTIGMVATPIFIFISGLTMGYLFQMKKDKGQSIRARFLDRGLFIFFVGHPLISISYYGTLGNSSIKSIFMAVHITDVIAVCIIFAPFIIEHLGTCGRLIIGILGYVFSWTAVYFWNPSALSLIALKESFIGAIPGGLILWYSFPIIPWFSLYLCCTVVGEVLFKYQKVGERSQSEAFIRRIGVTSLISSLFIVVSTSILKYLGIIIPQSLDFLSFYKKTPPGPTYILFFGGIGICIFYFIMLYNDRPFLRHFMSLTVMFGKTSFFVFLLQYFVFMFFLHSLHIKYTFYWPLYLILSILFISIVAKTWLHYGCNKFISMKYFIRLFIDFLPFTRQKKVPLYK